MIIWVIVNVASSLVVAMIVAFKMGAYADMYNRGEKIGMGLIVAGMLLRIGPILGKNLLFLQSPFDDWSTLLLHVGLAIYFIARLCRVHGHWYHNEMMKRQARRHLGLGD